jgi:phage terminase small subunit
MEVLLNKQEKIFAGSYLVHLQKAKAAVEAGYSKKNAKQIGYEVYNRPHVKAYIEESLKNGVISASEVTKLFSDTAVSNASDYLRPVQVLKIPKIKIGLADLIIQHRQHIQMEQEFCTEKGLEGEDYDKFQEGLEWYEDQIIKLKIELRRNPDSYRIIDGQADLVEEMQLDLKALTADKERGRVKSFKHTKDGVQFEMYNAQDAQKELAKIHGLYEVNNKQLAAIVPGVLSVVIVPPIEE